MKPETCFGQRTTRSKNLIFKILFFSVFMVPIAFGAIEIEYVTFGFNEGYKTGTWAPLTISVQGQDTLATPIGVIDDTYLAVEVRSFSSNVPIQRYVTLLAGSQRKNFYIYCPRDATQLVIELTPTPQSENAGSQIKVGRVLQEITLPTPLARKDLLVLVLAPSGDKLKRFLDKKQLAEHDNARVHIAYPNPTLLPRDWIGYSGVDVLVIREERRISKAQQTAMLDWVQRGGTLIVSGGSNYKYLHNSFIEPFLPVELKAPEQTTMVPDALHKQLGFQSFSNNNNVFERIPFSLKPNGEVLIGTKEHIYVAKRHFGDGQIVCLAFDYNAPPFGVSRENMQVGETFWSGFLSRHGKSPRHVVDRHALALKHEEKIDQYFSSTSVKAEPTQVPLIKLLAIALPLCLLSFGGFLLDFEKSKRKADTYWIGGFIFVLFSLGTIAVARNVLPNNVTANRLSIVSIYPERDRVHLQSYVSLRATARAETSIDLTKGSFMRQQETERPQKLGTLVQDSRVQLRGLPVAPWHPTPYVQETFLDAEGLPRILENTWHVTGKEMTYLGTVTFDTAFSTVGPRRRVTPAMPPDKDLRGVRKRFAQILRQEQVLRYLAAETHTHLPSYLIGWTSQGFKDTGVAGNVKTNSETLVIFHLSESGFFRQR